jgi:xylulokinase
MASVLVGD